MRDPSGLVVGAVDSYRYPVNFDLNLAIERMVTLRGYRFALRGGMDNITNHANPTAVNNVTSAPPFLQFLATKAGISWWESGSLAAQKKTGFAVKRTDGLCSSI